MGLVLLAGADPNAVQHPSKRAEPFVSKLVLTATGDSAALGKVEALVLGSDDAPHRADSEDTLAHALAPVLRDVRTTGVPEPGLDGYRWVADPSVASAMLGGSTSLSIEVDGPEESRVTAAADQVQEWVIEELWSTATANWPPCPRHRASHPLQPVVLDGLATWICPADGEQIGPIGSLPAPS